MRDVYGLRTEGQSGVRLTAFAEGVAPPQIVISEIDVGDPVQTIRFPTGTTLAPGQAFTIVEGGQNVWPEMRMTNANWGDAGILQAGVVLRNIGSNVIDCAFIDLTPETNKIHNLHRSGVSELEWRSEPITNVVAGETLQRFRNRDFNNRGDWTTGAPSFGTSIIPVIANGLGRFTVVPSGQAHFFSIVRVLE